MVISTGLKLVPLIVEMLARNSSPGEDVALTSAGDMVVDRSKFGSALATSIEAVDNSGGCTVLVDSGELVLVEVICSRITSLPIGEFGEALAMGSTFSDLADWSISGCALAGVAMVLDCSGDLSGIATDCVVVSATAGVVDECASGALVAGSGARLVASGSTGLDVWLVD